MVRKRAWSVADVYAAKFDELDFDGDWLMAIGKPERTGAWIVYGPPKNGKTTFSMMLAKYLSQFGRVYYNSVEEGLSKSITMAYERVGMIEVGGKVILEQESYEEMFFRLKKHKSPDIVFVDSVQFMEMKFKEYKELKASFPSKIFVFVSHINGRYPEGTVAMKIYRDANVVCRVEGRRAFIESRYEGDGFIDIDADYANTYWQGQGK